MVSRLMTQCLDDFGPGFSSSVPLPQPCLSETSLHLFLHERSYVPIKFSDDPSFISKLNERG